MTSTQLAIERGRARRIAPPYARSFGGILDTGADTVTITQADDLARPDVTVLIADRVRWVAEAIGRTLNHDVRVVAVASSCDDAVAAAELHRPSVAVIDLGLRETGGFDAARRIKEVSPDIKVLGMRATDDTALVPDGSAAVLDGCVSKEMAPAMVLEAILAAWDAADQPHKPARRRNLAIRRGLTTRELQVLGALADGCTGRGIAKRLGISENTVRTYVQNVLAKLHARTRLEAVTLAMKQGLITQRDRGPHMVVPPPSG